MNQSAEQLLKDVKHHCSSDESNGYIDFPHPCDLDERIGCLLSIYQNACEMDSPTRSEIARSVDLDFSRCLQVYAHRMAEIALATGECEYLKRGLLALALEGFRFDSRETLLVLAPLMRSAEKLSVNAVDLFFWAATFTTGDAVRFLRDFPSRSAEDRSLRAMGYREAIEDGEVRYRRTW